MITHRNYPSIDKALRFLLFDQGLPIVIRDKEYPEKDFYDLSSIDENKLKFIENALSQLTNEGLIVFTSGEERDVKKLANLGIPGMKMSHEFLQERFDLI